MFGGRCVKPRRVIWYDEMRIAMIEDFGRWNLRLLTYHNPHYRSQHTYQTQFDFYGLRFYFYVK